MGKKKNSTPVLDLHGFKQDEVYDAIDRFLLKHQNKNTVHIMTGKGKGLVKKVAQQYLNQSGYPFKALKMDNGKTNDGVLVIFMN